MADIIEVFPKEAKFKEIDIDIVSEYSDTNILLSKEVNPDLKKLGFTSLKGQSIHHNGKIVFGCKNTKDKNDFRQLGFDIVTKLKKDIKEITIDLNGYHSELAEGMMIATTEFDSYKKSKNKLKKIIFITDDVDEVAKKQDKVVSQQIVQNITNTPPEDAYSKTILRDVMSLLDGTDITIDVYNERDLEHLEMNGHLAVNRASRHSPMVIKLSYTPDNKNAKHHVLVGKGITYDSGGLSLKPSNYMTTMKADKAGAMALIGLMNYIASYGSDHKITCYLPLAENMIDGSSYKPDDIITMMNGKTVHIKNSDAEGRIILADSLCLAQLENKDIDTIYTIATLTGAAVYQFGNEAAGMVGFNDKIKNKIKKAGLKEDEIFMNAEFHKWMMDGVDDDIADVSNTGTPNMGCQKAGLFLSKFIKKKNKNKFVHLDIAGPAFIETPFGVNQKGATGFGVRTLINLLAN